MNPRSSTTHRALDVKRRDARPRAKRRIGQRGAAMVEGAVVMPLLISFYGIIFFVYQQYVTKQNLIMKSRHTTSSAALHQCLQGDREVLPAGLERVSSSVDVSARPYVGNVLQNTVTQGMLLDAQSRAFDISTETASNALLSNVLMTRSIEARSFMYCSPVAYPQQGTRAETDFLTTRAARNLLSSVPVINTNLPFLRQIL